MNPRDANTNNRFEVVEVANKPLISQILDKIVTQDNGKIDYLKKQIIKKFNWMQESIDYYNRSEYPNYYWQNHIVIWKKFLYCLNQEAVLKNSDDEIVFDFRKKGVKMYRLATNDSINVDIVFAIDDWNLFRYNTKTWTFTDLWILGKFGNGYSNLSIDNELNIYFLEKDEYDYFINFNWTTIPLENIQSLDSWDEPIIEVKWQWEFRVIYWTFIAWTTPGVYGSSKKNRHEITYKIDLNNPSISKAIKDEEEICEVSEDEQILAYLSKRWIGLIELKALVESAESGINTLQAKTVELTNTVISLEME